MANPAELRIFPNDGSPFSLRMALPYPPAPLALGQVHNRALARVHFMYADELYATWFACSALGPNYIWVLTLFVLVPQKDVSFYAVEVRR